MSVSSNGPLFSAFSPLFGGSRREPTGAHQVPEPVEDLCEYINATWTTRTATHLAAYVLWRLDWFIHLPICKTSKIVPIDISLGKNQRFSQQNLIPVHNNPPQFPRLN